MAKEKDPVRFEYPDPTPITDVPLRIRRLDPQVASMQRFIREELSQQAAAEGYGDFFEEDDFDVGDDYEPVSEHELDEELEEQIDGYKTAYRERNSGRAQGTSGADQKGNSQTAGDVQPDGQQDQATGKGGKSGKGSDAGNSE